MRLLMISPIAFLPIRSGVAAHIAGLVDLLESEGVEVTYDLFRFRVGGTVDPTPMRKRLGERLHLFDVADYGPVWLRVLTRLFRSMAAGPVGMWLIRLRERRSSRSGPLPLDAWYPPELDDFLRALLPGWDAVAAVYVFLSRSLLALPPGPRRILESVDVFSERHSLLPSSRWFSTTAAEEASGLQRSQTVVAISPEDQARLQALGAADVVVAGPWLPIRTGGSEGSVPTVLLTGSGNPHNRVALSRFLDESWPQIRGQVPEARLCVAGQLAPWARMHDGIVRVSNYDNPDEVYGPCWVCVNPDLGGTGISIKCLEALSYAKPLVTTTAGARGLSYFDEAMLSVEPHDLAPTIVKLLQDPTARAHLSAHARQRYRLFHEKVRVSVRQAYLAG